MGMINLLRKLFIANYQDVKREEVRTAHGVLASAIGIVTNLLLVLLKGGLAIYLAAETAWTIFPMALLVDAANNLSDLASCLVVILGFRISSKPADEKHPFGHERAEYVAGLAVSFLILVIAVETIRESIGKIVSQELTSYDLLSILLLAVSILVKVFQGLCYRKIGKIIDSKTLQTNAVDSLGDVLATTGVLLGAILSYTLKWDFLDPYIALGIAILITVAGLKMLFENIDPILGSKQDKALTQEIEQIALKHKGALGIHDLRIHSYGPTKKYISFHLEVDEETPLLEAHHLADHIENEVAEKEKAEVIIHVDPTAKNDPESVTLEKDIASFVKTIHPEIELHDFHLIACAKEKKAVFDLSIPFHLEKKEATIRKAIQSHIRKKDTRYRLIIHFDHPF